LYVNITGTLLNGFIVYNYRKHVVLIILEKFIAAQNSMHILSSIKWHCMAKPVIKNPIRKEQIENVINCLL
jgi:hypothetical protein